MFEIVNSVKGRGFFSASGLALMVLQVHSCKPGYGPEIKKNLTAKQN